LVPLHVKGKKYGKKGGINIILGGGGGYGF